MNRKAVFLAAACLAIPLFAHAKITRADMEIKLPYATNLIGQLRACMSVADSFSYVPAVDTEVAFLQYVRASDLLTDDYPEMVAKRIAANARMELEYIALHKDDPAKVMENCKSHQRDAKELVIELQKASRTPGRKK
ncbi:hypothetical protein [Acidovorax delafieldii]|uniref:hypothetical protein n=1 Tax=Acidovorax delafieldii TaxID=47920 RepID=UPI003ECC77C7